MDPDHLDDTVAAVHAPNPRAPDPAEDPGSPEHLPHVIGNAAFSRLAGPPAGRGVDRAARSQGAGPLDPEIATEIDRARGAGSPLPDDVRHDLEAGLDADLSGVRVHTDDRADSLNRSVQAEAFTTGTDVFFRSGRYAPGSSDGRRLLAHEVTHVVQQGQGRVPGGRVSHPDDAHEVEARAAADTMSSGGAGGGAVDRSDNEVEDEELGEDVVARQELDEEEEELSS